MRTFEELKKVMSENIKKKKLKQYMITLTNGTPLFTMSESLEEAKKRANEKFGCGYRNIEEWEC